MAGRTSRSPEQVKVMTGSAVLIVSHNGWNYLKRCLSAILNQTLPFTSILVVDNGSTKRLDQWLTAEQYPEITLLRLDSNHGFCGGVNHGLRYILRHHNYQYVALVNNDVYLEADWHAEAYRTLSADPLIGSCSTCLLQESRPDLVDSCGIAWPQPGRAENYLSGQPAPAANESNREIFGACAAAALYRIKLFEQIGLFDESLFAYQDDVDLALRAQTAGLRCVFVPGARGLHTGHGSNRSFPINGTYADYYNARNRLAVLVTSLPGRDWSHHWNSIIKGELTALLASARERRWAATMAGFSHCLLRLPWLLQRRWRNRN